MANTYDAEAAEPAPDTETPAEDTAEAQPKSTKAECNYRAGTPIKNCGLCGHYFGNAGEQEHTCEVVEGNDISQFGFCKYYEREDSPFPQRLGPQETAIVNDMMQSAPDQSQHAQTSAPTTIIGSRSYR